MIRAKKFIFGLGIALGAIVAMPSCSPSAQEIEAMIEMVNVDGGTFQMGATPDQGNEPYLHTMPPHSVTLSSYKIGKYEVTQKLWKAVMGGLPEELKGVTGHIGENLPVNRAKLEEIEDFLSKLNAITGKNYRLPTEAEWEFAARGGNQSRHYKYSGSNDVNEVAWYCTHRNDYKLCPEDHFVQPVGTKRPNELGIYDMSGNAGELCADGDLYYDYSNSQTNPFVPHVDGGVWIVRGGKSWSLAKDCRVSSRNGGVDGDFSFRLAL